MNSCRSYFNGRAKIDIPCYIDKLIRLFISLYTSHFSRISFCSISLTRIIILNPYAGIVTNLFRYLFVITSNQRYFMKFAYRLQTINRFPLWVKVTFAVLTGVLLGCLIGELVYRTIV